MALQRILVGLDGSPLAESILGTVRTLARAFGSQITLMHVAHVPESFRATVDVTLDGVVEREQREALSYLRRIAHELEGAGIAAGTAVAVGDAAAEIVRAADRDGSGLIALATHGRSGLGRWLYGSVADAVLHTTTRPLLLVRPTADPPPAGDLRRVIVPLDGSPLAEEALPLARELARRLAVPMELLRVVEIASLFFAGDPYAGFVDYAGVLEALEKGAAASLATTADRERREGIPVEVTATSGVVAETIARHQAAHPGSLLVVGSHGHTGWREVALGSVARRLVALAEGPVVVVRPRRAPTA